jgi:hypothetical protein
MVMSMVSGRLEEVITMVMGEEEAGWKSCLAQQFQLEVTSKTISSSLNSRTVTRGPWGRPTSSGTS